MQQYRKIAELNTLGRYLPLQSNDAALYKHDVLKYRLKHNRTVVLWWGREKQDKLQYSRSNLIPARGAIKN